MTIRHVNSAATGNDDGTTWTDACESWETMQTAAFDGLGANGDHLIKIANTITDTLGVKLDVDTTEGDISINDFVRIIGYDPDLNVPLTYGNYATIDGVENFGAVPMIDQYSLDNVRWENMFFNRDNSGGPTFQLRAGSMWYPSFINCKFGIGGVSLNSTTIGVRYLYCRECIFMDTLTLILLNAHFVNCRFNQKVSASWGAEFYGCHFYNSIGIATYIDGTSQGIIKCINCTFHNITQAAIFSAASAGVVFIN